MIERIQRLARHRNVLWFLFFAALATRLIGVVAGGTRAEDDDHWHLQSAQHFLAGDGFRLDTEFGPTYSYIQPGFAAVHVVFMTLFKNFFAAERVFLLLFSSFMIVCFFWLCRRLFNPECALVSTVWLILYPPQWFWMTRLNPHSFATNILVICFLLIFIAWDKKSVWLAFAVGILWGVLTQMRPEYELGIFILGVAGFIAFWRSPSKWGFLLLPIIGWALFLTPWVVRNIKIHGRPVISTTHYGINLWYVYNPGYTFESSNPQVPPELNAKLAAEPNEVKRADLYVAEAMKNIKENPRFALRQTVGNFLTYWRPWLSPKASSKLENLVYTTSYVPLFLLFLIGLFQVPWRDPRWLAIIGFMAYKVAAHVPLYMIVRFREATMPMMLLIATLPLCRFLKSRSET